VEDSSLTPEAYRALGLSPFESNWTSLEMKAAAAQLESLAKSDPRQLPHYKSPRSGIVFERITSKDNLAALNDASMPLSIRLNAAADYSRAIDAVVRVYVAALSDKAVPGSDVTELYAAQLRSCEAVMRYLEEFLPTLSAGDPSYPARMAALERVRVGLGEIVVGIVRALSEPRFFGVEARKRLVEYCSSTFDGIVPRLPLNARQTLLDQLTTASHNRNLANLQPQLNALRDRVTQLVSRASTKP
jgi:hypothetical protein